MTETPTRPPLLFSAGDSISWTAPANDYPASAGWSLLYVLINSTSKIAVSSTADGDDHVITISSVVSADYPAGNYKYTAYATNGTDRYLYDSGGIEILPDFSELLTYDGRTFAEKCLENIEAVITGKATQDNMAYSIGGRSLSKYSWEELLKARDSFRSEVAAERRKASGKRTGNRVLVRFT